MEPLTNFILLTGSYTCDIQGKYNNDMKDHGKKTHQQEESK